MARECKVLVEDHDAREHIVARELADGQWLIVSVPMFSDQVGFADIVSVRTESNGDLTFDSVLRPSLWSTYGLLIKGRNSPRVTRAISALERLGCLVMVWGDLYVSVAVPERVLHEVQSVITSAHADATWRAGKILIREACPLETPEPQLFAAV